MALGRFMQNGQVGRGRELGFREEEVKVENFVVVSMVKEDEITMKTRQ